MNKKVLFIEDDSLIIKLYSTRLKFESIEVVSATDGQTGLKKFTHEQPDLVVLDLMLPKLSGLEVLEKIRAQDKKVPILIYTVLMEKDRASTLKAKGATEYFVKADTTPRQLVEKIKSYLSN